MWGRGAGRLQRCGESGRSPCSRHVQLEESTRGWAEGHKLRIVVLHDRHRTARVIVPCAGALNPQLVTNNTEEHIQNFMLIHGKILPRSATTPTQSATPTRPAATKNPARQTKGAG